MSPSYQTATVGIHFGWKRDWQAVKRLLPLLENALAPFDARPHWGKLFTMSRPRLESLYKRHARFSVFASSIRPAGKVPQFVLGYSPLSTRCRNRPTRVDSRDLPTKRCPAGVLTWAGESWLSKTVTVRLLQTAAWVGDATACSATKDKGLAHARYHRQGGPVDQVGKSIPSKGPRRA